MTHRNSMGPLLCLALAALPVLACAQCSPGPETGGGIARCYDDGFVYVDASGNLGGYTSFWGYQNAAQVQGATLVFHSRSPVNAYTLQLVTDTYAVGAIPPAAPYAGTLMGPGPLLPDAPAARSVTLISLPQISVPAAATNRLVISWPSAAGWRLEQTADLARLSWTNTSATPVDDGTNQWITVSPVSSNAFFRLTKTLY